MVRYWLIMALWSDIGSLWRYGQILVHYGAMVRYWFIMALWSDIGSLWRYGLYIGSLWRYGQILVHYGAMARSTDEWKLSQPYFISQVVTFWCELTGLGL